MLASKPSLAHTNRIGPIEMERSRGSAAESQVKRRSSIRCLGKSVNWVAGIIDSAIPRADARRKDAEEMIENWNFMGRKTQQ